MSNPDFPWFRFYVREWLTDVRVRAMSLAARGAYIDLLCYQWENGTVPEDLASIARLIGATAAELEQVWPELKDRFPPVRRGGLQNPRLENERIASRRRRDSATTAGRASAATRRESAENVQSEESAMPHLAKSRSNGSPTILEEEGDVDEDEDEDEEKIVDAKPPTPSPPIPNPLPPAGPPTADDGRPVHDPPRTRWGEFVGRWNELAAAEDLPKIGGALSDARKRKARAVMGSMRKRGLDWFEVLAAAVRDRRGTWARGMRFPTLDQALREEIVDKLAEGFYERDRQAPSSQPEHLNRQSDFKPTKGPTRIKLIRPEERR